MTKNDYTYQEIIITKYYLRINQISKASSCFVEMIFKTDLNYACGYMKTFHFYSLEITHRQYMNLFELVLLIRSINYNLRSRISA